MTYPLSPEAESDDERSLHPCAKESLILSISRSP